MLVPERELRDRWPLVRRADNLFQGLARAFKVSPVVAARRVLDLELITRETFFEFYEEYTGRERRERDKESDGGDFYNTQNTRVGELFGTRVARAALEGRIGFQKAYELAGIRGTAFGRYASRLGVELP